MAINSTGISASPVLGPFENDTKPSKTLVEMRGIEPLTSALRTPWFGLRIH